MDAVTVDITPDPGWPEPGEGWVRRAPGEAEQHACAPPMRDATYTLAGQTKWTELIVDGQHEDLWRCRCGQLWRVGVSCDQLPRDRWGNCRRGSYHAWKLQWRHATWWQRLRYRWREPRAVP